MTTAQVCRIIGCHSKTLNDWTRQNRIAAFRKGSHYAYDPADVYAFLVKRRMVPKKSKLRVQ